MPAHCAAAWRRRSSRRYIAGEHVHRRHRGGPADDGPHHRVHVVRMARRRTARSRPGARRPRARRRAVARPRGKARDRSSRDGPPAPRAARAPARRGARPPRRRRTRAGRAAGTPNRKPAPCAAGGAPGSRRVRIGRIRSRGPPRAPARRLPPCARRRTRSRASGRPARRRAVLTRPARGLQPHDVVEGGRHAAGAGGVGAEREAHQAARRRPPPSPSSSRPRCTPGRTRIDSAPYGERVPTRPVANWSRLVLPTRIAPGLPKATHDRRGGLRHVGEGRARRGRGMAGDVDVVLDRERHAVERQRRARAPPRLRRLELAERVLQGQDVDPYPVVAPARQGRVQLAQHARGCPRSVRVRREQRADARRAPGLRHLDGRRPSDRPRRSGARASRVRTARNRPGSGRRSGTPSARDRSGCAAPR